jgi:hypothetical protein
LDEAIDQDDAKAENRCVDYLIGHTAFIDQVGKDGPVSRISPAITSVERNHQSENFS